MRTARRIFLSDEVLYIANEKQRTLLTLNRRHFIQLHRQQANHSGIMVCTFDPDFIGQAQRIADAVTQAEPASRLIRINRPA